MSDMEMRLHAAELNAELCKVRLEMAIGWLRRNGLWERFDIAHYGVPEKWLDADGNLTLEKPGGSHDR